MNKEDNEQVTSCDATCSNGFDPPDTNRLDKDKESNDLDTKISNEQSQAQLMEVTKEEDESTGNDDPERTVKDIKVEVTTVEDSLPITRKDLEVSTEEGPAILKALDQLVPEIQEAWKEGYKLKDVHVEVELEKICCKEENQETQEKPIGDVVKNEETSLNNIVKKQENEHQFRTFHDGLWCYHMSVCCIWNNYECLRPDCCN